MGSLKEYTLYFKNINTYGHEFIIPVLSMDLKSIDKFTTNYENELSMFNCMPREFKEYVKKILNKKVDINEIGLQNSFILKDSNDKNIDILFSNDIDVTYITQKELKEQIKSILLTNSEMQDILLNKKNDDLNNIYNFFKYLFKNYLNEKSIIDMMDTYDTKNAFPTLSGEKLLIASLACDKDNIIVLLTKIAQTNEGKRDVAIKYKKLYTKIYNNQYLNENKIKERFNSGLDVLKMKSDILNNLKEFKNEYEKEYV